MKEFFISGSKRVGHQMKSKSMSKSKVQWFEQESDYKIKLRWKNMINVASMDSLFMVHFPWVTYILIC